MKTRPPQQATEEFRREVAAIELWLEEYAAAKPLDKSWSDWAPAAAQDVARSLGASSSSSSEGFASSASESSSSPPPSWSPQEQLARLDLLNVRLASLERMEDSPAFNREVSLLRQRLGGLARRVQSFLDATAPPPSFAFKSRRSRRPAPQRASEGSQTPGGAAAAQDQVAAAGEPERPAGGRGGGAEAGGGGQPLDNPPRGEQQHLARGREAADAGDGEPTGSGCGSGNDCKSNFLPSPTPAEKKQGAVLAQCQLPHQEPEEATTSEPKCLVIGDKTDCTLCFGPGTLNGVDLTMNDIAARLHAVHESIVWLGAVGSSLLLYGCSHCTIGVAAQQVRVHDSRSINFHTLVLSPPVIERCSSIGFGPCRVSYKEQKEQLQPLGLDDCECVADGVWGLALDFNWHKKQPSPNWRRLDSSEMLPSVSLGLAPLSSVSTPLASCQCCSSFAPATSSSVPSCQSPCVAAASSSSVSCPACEASSGAISRGYGEGGTVSSAGGSIGATSSTSGGRTHASCLCGGRAWHIENLPACFLQLPLAPVVGASQEDGGKGLDD
eukprot:GHVT01015575.1.p1 GENE.GHVT01015575.1~~GHVT01015575.1.p1  ORF type:complete len:553 (+),score=143.62 GHVT01015575.1:252-1910(+)